MTEETRDDQFGATEFMLGSVRGYRTWGVSDLGDLRPVSYASHPWTDGENAAKCHGYPPKGVVDQEEGEEYPDYNLRVQAWRAAHRMIDCKHGFYAYFDGSSDLYRATVGVRGVIEGYGDVLVGSKGFRATKARVLALSFEDSGPWGLTVTAREMLRAKYPSVPIFASIEMMHTEFPAGKASDFGYAPEPDYYGFTLAR